MRSHELWGIGSAQHVFSYFIAPIAVTDHRWPIWRDPESLREEVILGPQIGSF